MGDDLVMSQKLIFEVLKPTFCECCSDFSHEFQQEVDVVDRRQAVCQQLTYPEKMMHVGS